MPAVRPSASISQAHVELWHWLLAKVGALMELKGGLHVSTEAAVLALDLERHGHALTARDGALLVTNGSALSADTRAAIQRLKRHLLAIAAYSPPEGEQ